MALEPTNPTARSATLETSLHVHRALDGDLASLEWIVARFSPLLQIQARQRLGAFLGKLYDPEDLVNDVWAIALPRLPALNARDGRYTPVLLKFLSTSLLNRLNSLMQKHIKAMDGTPKLDARRGDTPLSALPQDTINVVTRAVKRERSGVIQRVLEEELSEEDRRIIILRGIEMNPVAEVAVILGMLPNTVTVKYRRALERLRRKLPGSIFEELVSE